MIGFKLVQTQQSFWTRSLYFKSASELQLPYSVNFRVFNWDFLIRYISSEGKIRCGEDEMKDRKKDLLEIQYDLGR